MKRLHCMEQLFMGFDQLLHFLLFAQKKTKQKNPPTPWLRSAGRAQQSKIAVTRSARSFGDSRQSLTPSRIFKLVSAICPPERLKSFSRAGYPLSAIRQHALPPIEPRTGKRAPAWYQLSAIRLRFSCIRLYASAENDHKV